MGRIPRYQQDRLASSQVGTPGVDTSGQRLFQGLSQGADQITSTLFRVAQIDYQERRREEAMRRAELRAQQKALETAKRQVNVAGYSGTGEQQATELIAELKQRDQWDTDNTLGDYDAGIERIKQQTLEAIPDELTRLQTQKALENSFGNYRKELLNWTSGRTTPIATAKLDGLGNTLAGQLNDANLSVDEARGRLAEFAKNKPAYEIVYGPAAAEKMQAAAEKGIENYLAQTAVQQPDLLEQRINEFDDMYDAKDKRKFYADVRRTRAAEESARKAEATLQREANRTEAFIRGIEASPTGRLEDAPIPTLKEIEAEFGADLTSSQRITIAKKKKQAEFEGAERQQNDLLVRNIGAQIPVVNNIGTSLTSLATRVAKSRGAERKRLTADLARGVDQYLGAIEDLTVAKKALTDPKAKAAVDAHLAKVNRDVGKLINSLKANKNPDYIAASSRVDSFDNAVRPPSPYSDQRRSSMFKYFSELLMAREVETLEKANATASFLGNKKAVEEMRRNISREAAQMVERGGFSAK